MEMRKLVRVLLKYSNFCIKSALMTVYMCRACDISRFIFA